MSSIGIYPQIEQVVEEDSLSPSDLHPGIFSVEQMMSNHYPKINILRLGGLMGDDRYISKYRISAPAQVANHVHFEDISLIIDQMIDRHLESKIYNIVAPEHPSKQAILDHQLGLNPTPVPNSFGRVVSSKKSEIELAYQYKHPNPIFFKKIV